MRLKYDPENPPFDFKRARRITPKEVRENRKAIENKLGIKLAPRGRPPKHPLERHTALSIRLHPKVIIWAKHQAKRRGIGYQTFINDVLLKMAA